MDPPDSALEVNFDSLKVGKESTEALADDLGSRAAGSFDLPASFIFGAGNGALIADNACFTHVFQSCLEEIRYCDIEC